jgi:hypothetical protein
MNAQAQKQTKTSETKPAAADNRQPQPESTKTTEAKIAEVLKVPAAVGKLETKSAKIRALAKLGWKTGVIARSLGIRYQFAYNVLHAPVKK